MEDTGGAETPHIKTKDSRRTQISVHSISGVLPVRVSNNPNGESYLARIHIRSMLHIQRVISVLHDFLRHM